MIRSLHGLRGLAALSVVYSHAASYVKTPGPTFAGSMGVALFFVLSGFLMAHLYLPQKPTARALRDYAVARLARVYPLFAFVVVGAALAHLQWPTFPFRLEKGDMLAHLAGFGRAETIWTISTELQFYAVFTGLWLVHGRLAGREWHFVALLAATTVVLAFAGYSEDRIALTGYFHIFSFGMIAAIIHRQLGQPSMVGGLIAEALMITGLATWAFAGFAASHLWGNRWTYHETWLMTLLGVLILGAVRVEGTLVGRVLGSAPMLALGELSFGIYLLHRPVMWGLRNGIPQLGRADWTTRAVVLFCGVILAAWLAHRLIEVPCRQLIRARFQLRSARGGTLAND